MGLLIVNLYQRQFLDMEENDGENELTLAENHEEENKHEEGRTDVGDSEEGASSTDASETDGSNGWDSDGPASSDDDGKYNYLLLFYHTR